MSSNYFEFIIILDQSTDLEKSNDGNTSPIRKKVSSISVNIPAAGLGERPPSIVSSTGSTLDEGGFNEPSPEIRARLAPRSENQVTQQASIDSDILYNARNTEKNETPLTKPSEITQLIKSTSQDSDIPYSSINPCKNVIKYASEDSEVIYDPKIGMQMSKSSSEISYSPKNGSQVVKSTSLDSHVHFSFDNVPQVPNQQSVDSDVMYNSPLFVHTPGGGIISGKPSEMMSGLLKTTSPVESEPFIVSRSPMSEIEGHRGPPPESPRSEASLLDLDLQDVEYADASDEEVKPEPQPDPMTQAEADNLLSSR